MLDGDSDKFIIRREDDVYPRDGVFWRWDIPLDLRNAAFLHDADTVLNAVFSGHDWPKRPTHVQKAVVDKENGGFTPVGRELPLSEIRDALTSHVVKLFE